MFRVQALFSVLRVYKRSQSSAPICLNGGLDERNLTDKEMCVRLTMAECASDSVNSMTGSNRTGSEKSILIKRPRFFRSNRRQASEQQEEAFGEICDIRHSPNRIFKAAEKGNLKEFEKLYTMDNTRLEYRNAKGRSCIHFAAAANQCVIIQFIIDHGGDINLQDNEGNTALHDAVRNEAGDVVTLLLNCGANSKVVNADHYTPLHLAAQLNRVVALEAMAKFPGKLDACIRGKHGRTPLHVAAINDHAQAIQILMVDMGSCPKTTCDNGYTPVHEAARNACSKALQALITNGERKGYSREELMSCVDAEGNVPLHSAVHAGDLRAVELCMHAGARLCAQQHDLSTPLHLACAQGAIEIVRLMSATQPVASADCLALMDAQQMSPLHCAAMFDHDELLELLCAQSQPQLLQQPDRQGRTVLLLAAARGAWRCVHALLKRNQLVITQRDSIGRNLLHHVVLNGGNVHTFTSLIQQRSDAACLTDLLNERDQSGCTPLHYASREGNLKSIQNLLELGALINPKNDDNQSPLHFAARYGRFHTVKHLLASPRGHLIINEMDGEGMTCLHIASAHGHTRIVQLLLQRGALLHRDHRGRTPLHYAAAGGHTSTMQQLLLVHSHLLDQLDREGNTALHLAAVRARSNAAQLLLSLNCKLRRNYTDHTPMDYALHLKHAQVMRTFVLHPQRSNEIINYPTKRYTSLIEGLVANMPEVMTAVLDQGIQRSDDQSEDSKSYRIRYAFDCLRRTRTNDRPLPVLNLMVKYGREELICHPLCLKYLETKWHTYGVYYHTAYLLIYITFLACLTSGVLQLVDLPQHADVFGFLPSFVRVQDILPESATKDSSNATNSDQSRQPMSTVSIASSVLTSSNNQGTVQGLQITSVQLTGEEQTDWGRLSEQMPDTFGLNQSLHTWLCCSIVILYTFFSVLKEMHQMMQQGCLYFLDIVNLMLWALYATSTFTAIGLLFPDQVNSSLIYIVAAVATFLAWFNCLLYFQRFNSAGIYVVMFFEILLTLVRVLIVFCVLIIAFGLSFYILLTKCQQRKGFHSVPMSIVRIITMMLGEMDFLSTFLQPLLDFRSVDVISRQMVAATWFLIVFAVLMPILLMNLLIGLAVGDIETVRCNAQMKRLTMQVQMHTELERKLPQRMLRYVDKPDVFEYPNSSRDSSSQLIGSVLKFFVQNKTDTPLYGKNGGRTYPGQIGTSGGGGVDNELSSEVNRQKHKLRNVSRSMEQQLQLIKLIAKKMDIPTENDLDDAQSDVSDDDEQYENMSSRLTALSKQ